MYHQGLLWNVHCVATEVLKLRLNFTSTVIRCKRSCCFLLVTRPKLLSARLWMMQLMSKAVKTWMRWKFMNIVRSVYFMQYYRIVQIFHAHTYWEESSRLRPLICHWGYHNGYNWWCNQGFHNRYKWWCNKRLKQFACSLCQLQIDQVILCLHVKSSVNQQWLFADKKLESRCSSVYISNICTKMMYMYVKDQIAMLLIKHFLSILNVHLY